MLFRSQPLEVEIFNIEKGYTWQGASTLHEPSCTSDKCHKVKILNCPKLHYDLIKVDVDGFESNFICDLKPPMMIELGVNPGWSFYAYNKTQSMICLFNLFKNHKFYYLNQPHLDFIGRSKSYVDKDMRITNFSMFQDNQLGELGWNVLNVLIK